MNRVKIPKRKPELYKCLCCRGCTKKCLSNGKIARKEVALRNSGLLVCNNATEITFNDEKLIPTKSSR